MEKRCVFTCKTCGEQFYFDADSEWDTFFDSDETLWGHIQNKHPDLFREWCNFDTPDMRECLYNGPTLVQENRR